MPVREQTSKQLRKGVLDILVLFLLRDRDLYGYQIMQELQSRSRGYFVLKEGTLYPVLYRLEDQGYVEARWEQPTGRQAPKKYYKIKPEGMEALKEMQAEWLSFAYNVNLLLN